MSKYIPSPETVERLADRSPGEDLADPYSDVDLSELPGWWREAVETFQKHGLRPYRPPRFVDGTLKYEVIAPLEQDLRVDIKFVCPDVEEGDWELRIDGDPVVTVSHYRSPKGYSVFEISSDDIVEIVREHA